MPETSPSCQNPVMRARSSLPQPGPKKRAQGGRGAWRKVAMARTERYRTQAVRIRPLGSPWSCPNVLFRHVPGAVAWCRHVACSGERCTRGGAGRWVLGGYYPSPTLPVLVWYCQGPTLPRNSGICVHQDTPGTLQAPSAHPGSSHSVSRSRANKGGIQGHKS